MTDFDEQILALNRVVGRLEADSETRQRQSETLFKEVKELREDVGGIKSDVRNFAEDLMSVERKVAGHGVTLEEYKKFRNMGAGVAFAAAFAMSAVGVAIYTWVAGALGWNK